MTGSKDFIMTLICELAKKKKQKVWLLKKLEQKSKTFVKNYIEGYRRSVRHHIEGSNVDEKKVTM